MKNALEQKHLKDEYRKTAEALAASEAELRALFAAMQDVVMVLDYQGRYRKVAPTKPDLLYVPAKELVGKNLADIFSEQQARDFTRTILKVLETQQIQSIEYELSIRGKKVWFETVISPLSDQEVIWVARDVSERKRSEVTLLKHLQRQAQIAAFGRELAKTRDLPTICKASYRTLQQMTGCAYFAIALIEETHTLKMLYAALDDKEFDINRYPFLEFGNIQAATVYSQVIQTRKPSLSPTQSKSGMDRLASSTGAARKCAPPAACR